MSSIWIGDSRCKILKQLYTAIEHPIQRNHYIIDDFADKSWFETIAARELDQVIMPGDNIFFMLGLYDCISSCLWSAFDIKTIAKAYVKDLNTLVNSYPTANFYVCSVPKVLGDYAHASATNGIIKEKELNTAIQRLNLFIQSGCTAEYIDTNGYFASTSFDTYDGIHYLQESAEALHAFVLSKSSVYSRDPSAIQVNKEDLCIKNSYNITLKEMEPNAKYIWRYLGAMGWTMNAVAGLLGNLQQESKMSPEIWESLISGSTVNADGARSLNMTAIDSYYNTKGRYPGYGLVQWTPYSKYTDWCSTNKLDYWDIDSQLLRIIWEAANKQQWIAKPLKGYDLTFDDFTKSTLDAYWLAGAFAFCYERPARSTGTEAEQNALREERGSYGEYWYAFLSSISSTTPNTSATVDMLRVSDCTSTSAKISFLTRNIKVLTYSLDGEALGTIQKVSSPAIITLDKLTPNKSYQLTIQAIDTSNKEITASISFTTKQELINNFSSVKLNPLDNLPPHNYVQLITSPSSINFGYWVNNTHGYEICLLINGMVKSRKTAKAVPTQLYLKNYFNYMPKLGDSIQIGIIPYAADKSGKKIYSDAMKVSNSICQRKQSAIAYLNI